MAQKFNLAELVNQHQTREFKKKPHLEHKQPLPWDEYLKFKITNYPLSLWLAFYFALFSSVLLVAVAIDRSNLATNIMNQVRLTQQQNLTAVQIPDLSSFTLTTQAGMVALVTFPDQKVAGIDDKQVRFFQAENVSMTREILDDQGLKPWTLFARNPDTGTYLVDFSALQPGEYSFTLEAYNRKGQSLIPHTHQVTIPSNTIVRYQLDYHKDNLDNIQFTSYQAITPL